jgi:hypothetical protein
MLNGRKIVDCREILPRFLMAAAAVEPKDLAEFNLKLAKSIHISTLKV